MTTNAFVNALRTDPDEPDSINPIGWLKTAIISLQDLPTLVTEEDEDPDAYQMMIRELEGLHAGLTAALAEHDAAEIVQVVLKGVDFDDSRVVWIQKEFAVIGAELVLTGEGLDVWRVSRVHSLRTIKEHAPQFADYQKTKVRRAEFLTAERLDAAEQLRQLEFPDPFRAPWSGTEPF